MMTDSDRQLRLAASEDRQIRLAAESLFSASVNSAHSSYAQSVTTVRTPDTVNEVLIAGSRYNGRMSNVRRFFCLFVTFDLLFTILMWLICIMISGANVKDAFMEQVVHYQMKTSLFDIVMAAVSRFTVLLLFYALLYMNHWSIVALSTSVTCAFLITKVFIYDWTISNQPVFQVLLILTSFVLVWGEVWFLDIKVIPQENQAREWYLGFPNSERGPIVSPSTVPSTTVPENVGHFYTPMDSPENSDDEDAISRKRGGANSPFLPATISSKLPAEKIEECRLSAPGLLKKCYDLITSDQWKIEKVTQNGDTIANMTLPKPDGKIFKITGFINLPARKLINSLYDNIETSFQWNKHVHESKKIHVIDSDTDLIYQATKPLGNGAIGARDFVILRHRGKYNSYFISSGVSVDFKAVPNRKNFVRGENGVSCFAACELPYDRNKCQFVWLLNTNLKGWIPQKMVDMSMSVGLADFIVALRSHVSSMKD